MQLHKLVASYSVKTIKCMTITCLGVQRNNPGDDNWVEECSVTSPFTVQWVMDVISP